MTHFRTRAARQSRFKLALAAALLLTGGAAAGTSTWSGLGTSTLWSEGDNWSGAAPSPGDDLAFSGTGAQCTNANDLAADTAFANLTFNSGTRTYLLSGNRVSLGGNLVNNSSRSHRIEFDLAFDGQRAAHLTNGNLTLSGTLSGAGGVTLTGGKILYLSGTNTYQGPTLISNGVVQISNAQALGSGDGQVVILSNGSSASYRLDLANVVVTGKAVTVSGKGDNNGALQGVSGSNVWAGRIILGAAGDNRFGVSSPSASLVLAGVIEGPSGNNMVVRNKDDCGPTILSNTNVYQGETQVIVGTLRLSGGDDRLPTNTLVRLGNSSNVNWARLDLNGCNQTIGGLASYVMGTTPKITNLASNRNATLTANLRKPYAFTGAFDGNLNLVKTGPSNLTLSAASNGYTGQTIVREGELLLECPLSILESTLNTGDGPMGVIAFGTNTVVNIGGLVGTNNLAVTNRLGAPVHLRVRGAQSTSFSGQITAGGDFTKAGGGSFTMNNVNAYTGRTTLAGGTLKVFSEDSFGTYPASYVADRIVFDGGTLRTDSNVTWQANNRGMSLAAGGGTLQSGNKDAVVTVDKQLTGPGGLAVKGLGVFVLTASNTYSGVTSVGTISEEPCVLRAAARYALGNDATQAVIYTGSQLELADGLVFAKPATIYGAGNTVEPPPPSSPASNRGALQAAAGATAEWAGPVRLGADLARLGAQNSGHLIVSGVIDDGPQTYALRFSTNPGDRTRGVELRAHNTYGGSTDLTRGTLFLGASDALPPGSILDVHWAFSNNPEYSGLDLKGFDQTVAGLRNSGNTGANAMVTNSATAVSTLTVSQSVDTVYGGTIHGAVALVKDGPGSLTLNYPTRYTGGTTVRGGTLALGVTGAVAPGGALVLAGGTLNAGSSTNAFASLMVAGDSVINLGVGQLSFTAQTSDAWTGQLDLTGTLGAASLRLLPLLTASQTARIRYADKRVMQNADGYIVPWRGSLISVR